MCGCNSHYLIVVILDINLDYLEYVDFWMRKFSKSVAGLTFPNKAILILNANPPLL